MDKEQTKQLLHKISGAYGYAFVNKTIEQKRSMLTEWENALKNEKYDSVVKRLDEHISKSRYAPAISDLIGASCKKNFDNYSQSSNCTKEEWDNMIDLYNRYYHKDIKVGKLVDEYLEGTANG